MTKINTPFSGGCACGAIRYESTAEPLMMLHCHCRDCQQSSGGPFSSFVIVPTQAKPDSTPHIVAIRTASLDDPSWFNPQVDVWTSDAHQWDQMNSALPKFEKYPPAAAKPDLG